GRRRERWTTRPRRSPRGEEHELRRERQLAGRPADIAGHAPQTRAREEADGQRDGRGGPDQGETGSEQKRQDDQRDQGGRNDEVDGAGGGTERRRKSLAASGWERDERDRHGPARGRATGDQSGRADRPRNGGERGDLEQQHERHRRDRKRPRMAVAHRLEAPRAATARGQRVGRVREPIQVQTAREEREETDVEHRRDGRREGHGRDRIERGDDRPEERSDEREVRDGATQRRRSRGVARRRNDRAQTERGDGGDDPDSELDAALGDDPLLE